MIKGSWKPFGQALGCGVHAWWAELAGPAEARELRGVCRPTRTAALVLDGHRLRQWVSLLSSRHFTGQFTVCAAPIARAAAAPALQGQALPTNRGLLLPLALPLSLVLLAAAHVGGLPLQQLRPASRRQQTCWCGTQRGLSA